ncbi:MAG: valine--tRNA ligase [Lachnospirales bacterium]
MKELEKNYDHNIEEKIYSKWLEKGYFHQEVDKSKKPYSIVMPPPNVTGQLHLGHALDNTLQDILIRTKRMEGYNVLWQPGTDHASISTEVKIVNQMAEEGLTKEAIGREAFMKRAWAWKEEYGNTIVSQLKKMGSSCDWSRERFTMDTGLSEAVLEVFVKLYEKSLIYKGEKLINWCPHCETTISEAEVDHEDKQGGFWHFKYPIKDTNEFLEFATTRPETMLGDTAIAVNPEDEKYKKYVGKTVTVPFVNREIPIIADEYVEMDFGTGVVKITPAHDPNDFLVGQRHNLPMINIMNDDGTMNEITGKYQGLDRYEARKKIVNDMDNLGLFIGKKEITHSVGTHERCGVVIEPLIKKQWFVKMEDLAKPALDALYNKDIKFVPEHFSKTYVNWLENIQDWCISRQLWWGHRIPVYYCNSCGHIHVSKVAVSTCEKCEGTSINQDEDSLDTWFSSALWAFSTLGWPNDLEYFNHFYPTSVLVTGYDIIFFWVVRMVFSGIEHTGKIPFHDIYIHGLIRDDQGRKMSKSLGNGIDPLEIIEKYGADVLRLTLVTGNSAGNDLRFSMDRIESNRTFLNKLWNATRFVMMNFNDEPCKFETLTNEDKWILSKANSLAKDVLENINNYDLGIACQKVHDFIWDEYCDWYIEMVKPRLYDENDLTRNAALWTLKEVLTISLKLLHPFMPFITEEIFTTLTDEESIMISPYPLYKNEYNFAKEEHNIETIKNAVKSIRNIRGEMNVPPSKKTNILFESAENGTLNTFKESELFFKTLASGQDVIFNSGNIPADAVSVVIPNATIYIPFAELVDIEKEIERLAKEKDRLIKEVDRVNKKLSNKGFVDKAPEKVIAEEKEKKCKYESMLAQVEDQLSKILNQ